MAVSDNEIRLRIDLQPIQRELFKIYEEGIATKIGFGGSRGGGKSATADMLMLYRRVKYAGTNGLFVMRIYSDMIDIHINPLFDMYPALRQYYNQQSMILRLPNGSYIRYLSGDGIETLQQRKGRGFADVIIDQSEMFSEEEIIFLYTLNRSAKGGIVPKTLLCFNPGGISHSYHKRVFLEKNFVSEEDPTDYAFLKAVAWDNAYWSINEMAKKKGISLKDLDERKAKQLIDEYHKLDADDRYRIFIRTDYGRTLNQLPEHKRRAELFGDMDIFEGMFFEDFRRDHHVIDYKISRSRVSIAGLDYGNKTCLTLLQVDSEGTVVAADECFIEETNPTDRALVIADFIDNLGIDELQIIYDTDMDISQISTIGYDKTPIEIFRGVFRQRLKDREPSMRVVSKKSLNLQKTYRQVVNDSVKDYLKIRKMCVKCRHIQTMNQYIVCEKCGGEILINKSKLYISKKCVNLIKFFSEAIYDRSNDGDYVKGAGSSKIDHAYDSFKYAFMWLRKPIDKDQVDKRPKWLQELDKETQLSNSSIGFMGV